jgi:ERCC4-related helicase
MNLIPTVGAWVVHVNDRARRGFVEQMRPDQEAPVRVVWLPDQNTSWESVDVLRTGLIVNDEVMLNTEDLNVTRGLVTRSEALAEGVVRAKREIAGFEQVLVDFWHSNQSLWLPWQSLRRLEAVTSRFRNARPATNDQAERFRLRSLSYAIEHWHLSTGSLSYLNIDPLPHQLYLVDHILKSNNLNWLIADDVGLGKTIEVGLLMRTLMRQKHERFLLVVPAGLTRQWQDELRDKLGLDQFAIYGTDFNANHERAWTRHPCVIVSMDRIKQDDHLERFLEAPRWDLVVVDEAHRLSRDTYGLKREASDRFKMAASLRDRAQGMLLLSGTPHQGKDSKFQALLELIRPEWTERIERMLIEPDFLRDCVIRNRKADVTDIHGVFVFKGKISHRLEVRLNEAEKAFDAALQQYLREGYGAAGVGGTQSRAIGFVMNTYRKLHASSLRAIRVALERRLHRIRGETQVQVIEEDERFAGEFEEVQALNLAPREVFFIGEEAMLATLITQAKQLEQTDSKLKQFMEGILEGALRRNKNEKLLVFTEYRTTQQHLESALVKQFGADKVSMLHGSMNFEERKQAIAHFESTGQFLISTEAGGEGLNLQRFCHQMVNYDLPWNPMRLVQRVGRLYRYGQEKNVVVFNVQTQDTLDQHVLSTMYDRLQSVAQTMIGVSDEYQREALLEDILGQLAAQITADDIEAILEAAQTHEVERTEERINAALERARDAAKRQDDLLRHAAGYQPNQQKKWSIGFAHVLGFITGMLTTLEIPFETLHQGNVLRLELSETLQRILAIRTKHHRVTLERIFAKDDKTELLEADSKLMQYLMFKARDTEFGGRVAVIDTFKATALVHALLRWQNERGTLQHPEFISIAVHTDGRSEVNPIEAAAWLLEPQKPSSRAAWKAVGESDTAKTAIENHLRTLSNNDLIPSAWYVINAAWGETE